MTSELRDQFHMALGFFQNQIIDQIHILGGEFHQRIQCWSRFFLPAFKRNDDTHIDQSHVAFHNSLASAPTPVTWRIAAVLTKVNTR